MQLARVPKCIPLDDAVAALPSAEEPSAERKRAVDHLRPESARPEALHHIRHGQTFAKLGDGGLPSFTPYTLERKCCSL